MCASVSILSEYVQTQAKLKKMLPDEYLDYVAKGADKGYLSSHVGKFGNPDSRTNILAEADPSSLPGYVCYGNTKDAPLDVAVAAVYIAAGKFLCLTLEDGQTVLKHLLRDTDFIRKEMEAITDHYDAMREQLLTVENAPAVKRTDSTLKQIYFPVGDGEYHLMTPLTSPSFMYALKKRLLDMNRGRREARDGKQDAYCEIRDITAVGFGGSHPKNISALNALNGGVAWLLPSFPPVLDKNKVHKPRREFFFETVYYKRFSKEFVALAKVIVNWRNNNDVRIQRDDVVMTLMEGVISYATWLREENPAGWTVKTKLDEDERIWLDSAYDIERKEEYRWIKSISMRFAGWIDSSMQKMFDKIPKLGSAEKYYLQEMASKALEGGVA